MSELGADAVAERLESIRTRVTNAADAAGREASSIRVLAVTKGHSVDAVTIAAQLGLRDIGESRVQEAQAKSAAYEGAAVSWHMVGHVQRNKARAAAVLFDTVHSVDSAALATALARHRAAVPAPLRVFVEVELSGIAGRSGVSAQDAPALIAELRSLPELQLEGLMTIAPPGPPELAARCFSRLRDLRAAVADSRGIALPGLSMGMSGDFEIAIAHGATVIRLGRVLFGDPVGSGT
jgi:pyridoxal phosphate enzyme (YggS family)